MRDLVLDTGALIALQRDRALLRTLVRVAHEKERRLVAAAPVLTEFLGPGPAGLRPAAEYVAGHLEVSGTDEVIARRAARLIQAMGKYERGAGAIDAIVAATAERLDALLVFDGDRADFEALAGASGQVRIKELRELA